MELTISELSQSPPFERASAVYHCAVCKAEFSVMALEPFEDDAKLPCKHSFLSLERGPAPLPKMVVMALRNMIERAKCA